MNQLKSDTLSIKESVYREITRMIGDGRLTTRDRITEQQLIDYFQVSKSPIREALIQLCGENVLRSTPRYGYQVVKIMPNDIRELIELRMYLELPNINKVIDGISPEQIRKLKEQNALRLAPSAGKEFFDLWHRNETFHMTLIQFGKNHQLELTMRSILSVCSRAYAQIYHENPSIVSKDEPNYHDMITSALERHDVFGAYEHLRNDIFDMERWITTSD